MIGSTNQGTSFFDRKIDDRNILSDHLSVINLSVAINLCSGEAE
jgi:hypothetical protein